MLRISELRQKLGYRAVPSGKKIKHPKTAKTGNKAVDFAVGQIPLAKKWNTGFNLGKIGFVAKQTYENTCKRKK